MYDFATNSVRAQEIRSTHKIGKCHAMIARGGAVRPPGYSCKKVSMNLYHGAPANILLTTLESKVSTIMKLSCKKGL